MVEGHGVHRVAASARRHLVGKRFTATSPNGRFAHGAEVIDGKELKRVDAIGKNLFYFFNCFLSFYFFRLRFLCIAFFCLCLIRFAFLNFL